MADEEGRTRATARAASFRQPPYSDRRRFPTIARDCRPHYRPSHKKQSPKKLNLIFPVKVKKFGSGYAEVSVEHTLLKQEIQPKPVFPLSYETAGTLYAGMPAAYRHTRNEHHSHRTARLRLLPSASIRNRLPRCSRTAGCRLEAGTTPRLSTS